MKVYFPLFSVMTRVFPTSLVILSHFPSFSLIHRHFPFILRHFPFILSHLLLFSVIRRRFPAFLFIICHFPSFFIVPLQTVVGSIVWVFRRLEKPKGREMSARDYALHSVCPQLSYDTKGLTVLSNIHHTSAGAHSLVL